MSIILASAISSSAISMIANPGLPHFGAAIFVGLIILLSLKEILSASDYWNKSLNNSFNLAILPLLLCFLAIIFYEVVFILSIN
jgi:hypothetical protein